MRLNNPPPFRKITTVLIAIMLLAAIYGNQGLLKLYRLSRLEKQLESSIMENRRENQRLAFEIKRLKDPLQLERVVREELGLVRPNELVFITEP
ncbi:MAG: septum formation initiator family protein [Deltaproteobacteria bacterium]|nr:septum formation initiator family protein [Deltaproteobacteria bacterium]